MLNGEGRDLKLMQSYKQKSESMVNEDNKAIAKAWIETRCTKMVQSPSQRGTVVIKNAVGEVISRERVLLTFIHKKQGQTISQMLQNGGTRRLRSCTGSRQVDCCGLFHA